SPHSPRRFAIRLPRPLGSGVVAGVWSRHAIRIPRAAGGMNPRQPLVVLHFANGSHFQGCGGFDVSQGASGGRFWPGRRAAANANTVAVRTSAMRGTAKRSQGSKGLIIALPAPPPHRGSTGPLGNMRSRAAFQSTIPEIEPMIPPMAPEIGRLLATHPE